MNKLSNEKYGKISALLLCLIAACVISGAGITNYYNLSVNTGTNGISQVVYAAEPSVFGDSAAAQNSNNDATSTTSDNLNTNAAAGTGSSDDDSGSDDQTGSSDDDSGSDDQKSQSDSDSETEDSQSASVSIVGIKGDNSFDPNPIEVKTGGTVTWTNEDNEGHTVTSGSDEGPSIGQDFDSGLIGSDDSYSNTFDKAGTYDYFCTIHPSMVGQVEVKS